jgi:predicted amino acid racemase
MSSDHLVLDIGDERTTVGDEIRFTLGYGALVRAMTSPFVTRAELPKSRVPGPPDGPGPVAGSAPR